MRRIRACRVWDRATAPRTRACTPPTKLPVSTCIKMRQLRLRSHRPGPSSRPWSVVGEPAAIEWQDSCGQADEEKYGAKLGYMLRISDSRATIPLQYTTLGKEFYSSQYPGIYLFLTLRMALRCFVTGRHRGVTGRQHISMYYGGGITRFRMTFSHRRTSNRLDPWQHALVAKFITPVSGFFCLSIVSLYSRHVPINSSCSGMHIRPKTASLASCIRNICTFTACSIYLPDSLHCVFSLCIPIGNGSPLVGFDVEFWLRQLPRYFSGRWVRPRTRQCGI